MHTVSELYSLPSVENTRIEIRMLKYVCSVKGNVKQTSTSKNLIRGCVFFIPICVFLYAYPLYGCSVKAA